MKFQIEKEIFLKILQRVQGIVERRNTMPILANILITAKQGKIEVIATDLEVSIKDICDAAVTEEGRITINARKQIEKKTAFPPSTDETRNNINGVFVEKDGANVRMVATDGHRLALMERSSEWPVLDKGVILPRKGVLELKKLLDDKEETLYLSFTSNSMVVKKDGTIIIIRLIDGEFPDYRQVIPKGNERKKKVERIGLLNRAKRA